MMTITETPKIKIERIDTSGLRQGSGGQVPIFISPTMNATAASGILQFTKFSDANKTVSAGGIGTDDSNILLPILKDFFEENIRINSEDDKLCVPEIYVKDLGTSTPSTATPWVNAIKDAKTKKRVQVEAYVFQKPADATAEQITALITSVIGIMTSVAAAIDKDVIKGNPRLAYFTILGYDDTQIQTLTAASSGIRNSAVTFIDPNKFGKYIARICNTPFYDEPGYYKFRSVSPGELLERTEEMEETLQAAGILFGHDEYVGEEIYPKINLAVSTAFAEDVSSRPKDALLHVRRNVDQLIRDAVKVVHPQLKRRELESFLSTTQADLDVLVNSKIKDGHMKEGTSISIYETDEDKLEMKISAYPVKSTGLITVPVAIDEGI